MGIFTSVENESEAFTEIAMGWKLYGPIKEIPAPYTEELLMKIENATNNIAKRIDTKPVMKNYTTKHAADQSLEISKFVTGNNSYSIIILKAEDQFEGKGIWNVMMSMGLKWGDMDLLHWNNNFDIGDDQLMSVWTSTDPGYFFPEEIVKGNVQTKDLIFGFSIPRSIAPTEC